MTELSEEVEMGRMKGPFQVPPCWYEGSEPTTEEDPDVSCDSVAALAFSIEQTSGDGSVKIRRGEDWKRSFGNRYAFTSDKPDYNDLDDIVTGTKRLHQEGSSTTQGWTQDHEGAYRQLPGSPTWALWLIIFTALGPLLFRHLVIPFGPKGAVWAYNRVGDIICAISSTLAASIILHFVDDYIGLEEKDTAQSAFHTFSEINKILGFRMKETKKQPPSNNMVVLGHAFSGTPTR